MNGKAALDSNAIIRILNGKLDIPSLGLEEILVPLIAAGEMFFGVYKSMRVSANRSRLMAFLNSVSILPVDLQVTERYGQVKAQLRRLGKPIPENDIWIAATALRHNLPLVANDKHFDHVEGLVVIRTP
jgi:tRNA(fMet)-specific endonuclease VapC